MITRSQKEMVNGKQRTSGQKRTSHGLEFKSPNSKKRSIEMPNGSEIRSAVQGYSDLQPFVHQVTGRSHMLSVDSTTLCKTLSPRELLFNTSIPKELLPYVPRLKGVLYAQLLESDEKERYIFKTTEVFAKSHSVKNGEKNVHASEGNFEHPVAAYRKVLFKGLERSTYDEEIGFTSHQWTVDKDREAVTESYGANPWSIRQHRREINRILLRDGDTLNISASLESNENRFNHRFSNLNCSSGKFLRGYMMLEDVTFGFRHPSLIDLKLGRQLERRCSSEKKHKHHQISENSSTATLMLRMAGMQVYQPGSGHYLCRDKYFGRGLSPSGFMRSVNQFLYNGQRYVVEVIQPIIEQLIKIREVLEKQESFRFYASSIIILYEGDDTVNGEDENGRRKTEVRLIDFTHATFNGFDGDKSFFRGPDDDCLLAITNVIKILKDIEAKENNIF